MALDRYSSELVPYYWSASESSMGETSTFTFPFHPIRSLETFMVVLLLSRHLACTGPRQAYEVGTS